VVGWIRSVTGTARLVERPPDFTTEALSTQSFLVKSLVCVAKSNRNARNAIRRDSTVPESNKSGLMDCSWFRLKPTGWLTPIGGNVDSSPIIRHGLGLALHQSQHRVDAYGCTSGRAMTREVATSHSFSALLLAARPPLSTQMRNRGVSRRYYRPRFDL